MPFYERQPYIQSVHQLIAEVLSGDIRIPRFQRPGSEITWQPEQRGDLLDSLYRSYPVGTILLWSTTHKVKTLDVVGGYRISRPPEEGRPLRVLLDGHQRVSTLVWLLGQGITEPDEVERVHDWPDEQWVFDLREPEPQRELPSRDRFVLLKPDQRPTNTQLPLRIVMSRTALNRWIRGCDLDDDAVRKADGLRDRLREYSIPIAVLATESLQEATESFKRINSSGTPMSDFHMVAALTHGDEFDLSARVEEQRGGELEEIGWQNMADSDLLRVVAGLIRAQGGGQHPLKLDIDGLARSIRDQPALIERGIAAIVRAAELLREQCGVYGPSALPYSYQLITIAVTLHSHGEPTEHITRAMRVWFWLTTYGGVYAGVNSAVYDRAADGLERMIGADSVTDDAELAALGLVAMSRDATREVPELAQSDFRTARTKACMMAMARVQDGESSGAAHRALADGVASLQLLFSKGRRSSWHHLVIVTPGTELREFRDALRRRAEGEAVTDRDSELLAAMAIDSGPPASIESLLEQRRLTIAAAEREFVEKLGLTWVDADA